MFWLAIKTMIHERNRLVITVMGITFSTVLVITQIGIYLGMMGNATAVIRNTDADIWVASKNIQCFDFANPFPQERINIVRSLPEVSRADKLLLTWGFIKLQNGGREQVQIIGYDPERGMGAPWSMILGSPHDVKGGRYMIIDRTSEQRIGALAMDSLWELSNVRFRLKGISEGIRSFTTAPMVFMNYAQAQSLVTGLIKANETTFVAAKLHDPSRANEVAAKLRVMMKDNDVFTRREFVNKTVMYWTVQTGMGMGFFLTAILGLIVGGSIVGQTIYANTMEHIREFGTLKAVGASNADIYTVIFSQAGMNAVAGFAIGLAVMLMLRGAFEKAGVTVYVDGMLALAVFLSMAAVCLLSAFFSVRKVRNLDPASVFRA